MTSSPSHVPQSASAPAQTILIVDDTPQNLTVLGELV